MPIACVSRCIVADGMQQAACKWRATDGRNLAARNDPTAPANVSFRSFSPGARILSGKRAASWLYFGRRRRPATSTPSTLPRGWPSSSECIRAKQIFDRQGQDNPTCTLAPPVQVFPAQHVWLGSCRARTCAWLHEKGSESRACERIECRVTLRRPNRPRFRSKVYMVQRPS